MTVSGPSLKDHLALSFTFGRNVGGEFRESRGFVDLRPVPLMRRHRTLIVRACFRRT